MAAVKIQSLKEVVRAYLKSLGFEGDRLSQAADYIAGNVMSGFESGDVVAFLDGILLQNIRKNIVENKLGDEQALALFKAAYLVGGGAEKWGVEVLNGKKFPAALAELMTSGFFTVVPEYQMSRMQPQKIEPVRSLSWPGKILRLFRKGQPWLKRI